MRLRAHSGGVTMSRSKIAIAGVLAFVILAAFPRAPKRQDVARQYPPSPSAAEESGISEPVGMLESRDWFARADIHKPRPQIPRDHVAAPVAHDNPLTTPAIRHDPSSISEEAQIVGNSAVSPDGLSRSGILTPHNLESKAGDEARVEEGHVSVPGVRSDPQVTRGLISLPRQFSCPWERCGIRAKDTALSSIILPFVPASRSTPLKGASGSKSSCVPTDPWEALRSLSRQADLPSLLSRSARRVGGSSPPLPAMVNPLTPGPSSHSCLSYADADSRR